MLTSKLSFEKGTNETRFIDVSIIQIAKDWAIMCYELKRGACCSSEKPANRREPDPSRMQRQELDTLREKGP